MHQHLFITRGQWRAEPHNNSTICSLFYFHLPRYSSERLLCRVKILCMNAYIPHMSANRLSIPFSIAKRKKIDTLSTALKSIDFTEAVCKMRNNKKTRIRGTAWWCYQKRFNATTEHAIVGFSPTSTRVSPVAGEKLNGIIVIDGIVMMLRAASNNEGKLRENSLSVADSWMNSGFEWRNVCARPKANNKLTMQKHFDELRPTNEEFANLA